MRWTIVACGAVMLGSQAEAQTLPPVPHVAKRPFQVTSPNGARADD